MIVENQKVKVTWSNRNKTYYTNIGYSGFKNGLQFDVLIEHLPLNSNAIVEIICDFCGKHHFNEYKKKSKSKNQFCCRECQDNFLIGKPSWNSRKIFVNCGYCNKEIERSEWELKEHKHLFCNRECADKFLKEFSEGRPKVERFKVNCDQCGLEIERTETEIKRAKNHFCTKECADKFMEGKLKLEKRTGHEVECHNCGLKYYFPKYRIDSQERYFCSEECRREWLKSNEFKLIMSQIERTKMDKILVNCSLCGEVIEKYPSEIRGELHFCNNECKAIYFINNNPNPKKEKIKVYCYNCGKEKFVNESVYNLNNYFFCSHDCYKQKRFEICNFPQTGTSIHVKINELLENIGIDYKNEKMYNYYSVDIYLPKASLGIEIMGDYWHSNPLKYSNISKLNDVQKKDIRRDKSKMNYLKKYHNLNVLYLWETDINKNLEICEKLIKFYINNNGILEDFNSFNYSIVDDKLTINENRIKPYFM